MAFSWIFPTLALIIIFLFLLVVFIIIFRERNEVIPQLECPSGSNPVNFYTGERFTDRTSYNPAIEVCQRVDYCLNKPNTYAVQDNGSSFPNVCPPGVNCDCVQTRNCPDAVVSYFTPFLVNGQYFWLSQGVYNQLSNEATWNVPLQLTNESLCSIGESSLINVFNHRCQTGRLTLLSDGGFACTNAPSCPLGTHPTFNLETQAFGCSVIPNYPTFWNES